VPLFKLLYRYALESLIYLMEEQRLAYNNVLYSEDDPARYVYVIFRGEFKLYKRVACGKDAASSSQDVQERARRTSRNVSLKTIGLGEVLGCWEAYERTGAHQETCVCKSQDGLVLRIEKAKFLKKVLSPENNLEEIVPFLEQRGAQRRQEVREFLQKYESNNLFVRYLHTPSAKSRRVNTESAVYRQRSERAEELRKLSSASNNFFNEFNKTVKQEVRSTRISVKKSIRFNESREPVPSRIKDIIGIVDQEANYYKIRKPKENITLFDFNISVPVPPMQKVPIHVKKKYDILFKKQNQ
jgi:CRP-like cAMP-binding protein